MVTVEDYLQRIGLHERSIPSLEGLTLLQRRHMLAVPFENLSVAAREPIVLAHDRLVSKIVERRRGGFCYELNGAFAWLLRKLGYSLDIIEGGVFDSADDAFGPSFDHMALIVDLGTRYLVDVGFGDSTQTPIPLPDGRVQDVGGRYRVLSSADGLRLEKETHGRWQPQVLFRDTPQRLDTFGGALHLSLYGFPIFICESWPDGNDCAPEGPHHVDA